MKSRFLKFSALMFVSALLAGCKPTISEETPLTDAEFNIVLREISNSVPLVVERGGTTIYTNSYRESLSLPTPVLQYGKDLLLTVGGQLKYEDEENGVYLYPDYTITWDFYHHESTAEYEFAVEANGGYRARPAYPMYVPEYTSQGVDITPNKPSRIAGILLATLKVGDHQATIQIDMILEPQAIIPEVSMLEIRERKARELVRIRGYVTGIYGDWNAATVVDGEYGVGIYKIQEAQFDNTFKLGDLIEVTGGVSAYHGMAQLSFLNSLEVINPDDFPDIEEPITTQFTHEQLYDQMGRASQDLTGPLQDRDSANVKFDKPFTYKHVTDDKKNILPGGLNDLDTTGKLHRNIVVEGTRDNGSKFEVSLAINYHMDDADRVQFKEFFMTNGSAPFYYTGTLGWYDEPTLNPYHFAGALTLA